MYTVGLHIHNNIDNVVQNHYHDTITLRIRYQFVGGAEKIKVMQCPKKLSRGSPRRGHFTVIPQPDVDLG